MGPIAAVAAVATTFAAATGAFDPGKPPPVIDKAPNPIAHKFPPINFASIFDELSKEKFDIIKGQDGKMSMKFSNSSGRIDLSQPVSSGNVDLSLPAVRNIDSRATEVVALSAAMTRLANTIEEMEKTSPYLIEQNRELIDSFRKASTKALDRGFDFRQNAIDQKLTRLGLANSSSAFGVQVALAREKAYAYATMELKEAELAQGLKQQSIANLQQRGELLGKNAQVELGRFNSEKQIELANEELVQKQALGQKALELEKNQQRINTEFSNKAMDEKRRDRMAEIGVNLYNSGNNRSIMAQNTDNTAIAQQNQAQYEEFRLTPDNPWKAIGRDVTGKIVGSVMGSLF